MSRFDNKLFFEFSSQEILNIIEALTLYKEVMLPEKYRSLIDDEIKHIIEMLKVQNIDTFASNENINNIGSFILADGQLGILLKASETEGFFKVAVIEDNQLKIIEVPFTLIKKVEN